MLNLNGMALDVTVERISGAGCRIRMDAVVPVRRGGDTMVGTLSALPQANLPLLSHARTIPVRLVGVTAAGEESVCDLVFETLTPGSYFALADLMYSDAGAMSRFQMRRRTHKDIVSGTLQFVRWGLSGPVRAFAYLMTTTAAPKAEEPAARPRKAERQRAADAGRPADAPSARAAEARNAAAPRPRDPRAGSIRWSSRRPPPADPNATAAPPTGRNRRCCRPVPAEPHRVQDPSSKSRPSPTMPAIRQRQPAPHRATALTLAGLLVAATAPASAQSFLGRGAPQVLTVPDGPSASRGPARAGVETGPVAPAPAAALPQRPFPALSAGLRLSGEESSLQWPVYLTETQSRERLRLRIGYLAAISVVPDVSFLTATVNGVAIGRSEIKAPGAIRILEFDIPADLLKPGYNAVAISGVQRHRVDCSLDATYELWTQIEPAWTGLVSAPGAIGAASLRDLPAIAPDHRGVVPIRIVLRNRPGFATFERLIGLAQRVALAGGFSQTAVEFAAEPGDRPASTSSSAAPMGRPPISPASP
ncbi:cellulose biosynthesis cyclic di-GMP-binding regulatory protein BcsB [Methylorubrum suomiense]